MKRSLSLIVCSLLAFSVSSLTQESNNSVVPPSKEDVLRFMDLMQTRARMEQLLDGMKKGMKAGAEAGFKQRVAQPTPAQIDAVEKLTSSVFQDFPIDEILDSIVPIYQRHLTKSDLDAIISFYSSPVGQRLLKEQPAMMAEGMQAGQEIMLKRIPELRDRLNSKVAELADHELQRSPNKAAPK